MRGIAYGQLEKELRKRKQGDQLAAYKQLIEKERKAMAEERHKREDHVAKLEEIAKEGTAAGRVA